MKNYKIDSIILSMVTIFLMLRCSHYGVYNYSVLESAPYVEYGNSITPEFIDTPSGLCIGGGGRFMHMTADVDTTIDILNLNMLMRYRVLEDFDFGCNFCISGSASGEGFSYPYCIFDCKYLLADEPLYLGCDFGVGMGSGESDVMTDIRLTLLFGVPIVRNHFSVYVAPRVMALMYTWQREYHGTSSTSHSAISSIYGSGAGMTYTIPVNGSKLKCTAELNYLIGHEPKLDRITYYILQPGCHLQFLF